MDAGAAGTVNCDCGVVERDANGWSKLSILGRFR